MRSCKHIFFSLEVLSTTCVRISTRGFCSRQALLWPLMETSHFSHPSYIDYLEFCSKGLVRVFLNPTCANTYLHRCGFADVCFNLELQFTAISSVVRTLSALSTEVSFEVGLCVPQNVFPTTGKPGSLLTPGPDCAVSEHKTAPCGEHVHRPGRRVVSQPRSTSYSRTSSPRKLVET